MNDRLGKAKVDPVYQGGFSDGYDSREAEVERLWDAFTGCDAIAATLRAEIATLRAEVKNISVQKDANASLAAEHRSTIATLRERLKLYAGENEGQLDTIATLREALELARRCVLSCMHGEPNHTDALSVVDKALGTKGEE